MLTLFGRLKASARNWRLWLSIYVKVLLQREIPVIAPGRIDDEGPGRAVSVRRRKREGRGVEPLSGVLARYSGSRPVASGRW